MSRRSASFAVSSSACRSAAIASSSRPSSAQQVGAHSVPQVVPHEIALELVDLDERGFRAVDRDRATARLSRTTGDRS